MLGLALAASRTLPLEGPDKADILVGMLGNGDVLAFHHVGDVGEFGLSEALEDSSVSMGVKRSGGGGLLVGHTVLIGSVRSAWRHFEHVMSLGKHFA
jgi:hypothetical protein